MLFSATHLCSNAVPFLLFDDKIKTNTRIDCYGKESIVNC
jgi:hypothetical protein